MSDPQLFAKGNKVHDPYANTKVTVASSQTAIHKLLEDYGADPIRWTSSGGLTQLEFRIYVEMHGVNKYLDIRLQPPAVMRKVKTWNQAKSEHEKINVPDMKRGMRMLYFYLKTKLESIYFGLVDAQEEFLSNVVMTLPGGGDRTIGKVLTEAMSKDQLGSLLEDKSTQTSVRKEEDIDGRVIDQ